MRQLHARLLLAAWLPCLTRGATGRPRQDVAQYLPLIGSSRGTAFTRQCPADQVLTGVRARLGRVIEAIGIKCRPVLPNGSLGEESDIGTLTGGTSGTFGNGSCPPGSVAVGQAGSAANPSGVVMFVLRCRRWDPATRSWGGATTALIQLLTGAAPAITVSAAQQSATQESVDCARQTQPATHLRGRVGTIVDALGVTCDEP
jgi:hypothetical protein